MKYILNFIYMIILRNVQHLNAFVPGSSYDDVVEDRRLLKTTTRAPAYHFYYGRGPKGPKFWSTSYPMCGGNMQSPINIELHALKEVKLEDLKWQNYDMLPNAMFEINNDHTVSVRGTFANFVTPLLSGGPLTSQYEFVSLHFHWGVDESTGSEHTLNNKRFIMEMHCIHKMKDVDLKTAAKTHNGLVVVGYFFELGAHDNSAISSILERYTNLMVDVNVELHLLNTFKLSDLMLKFTKDYVTYQGSLTTPPCHESVIWILSPYPVYISARQLVKFRKISQSTGMENNYRPVQPIGNRTIYLITNNALPIGKSASATDND